MPTLRTIVKIDEEKCDGCGQCVPACAEGALAIIDGKARLVSEVYCDGLGACLGECPQGAITVEEREAEEFDIEATQRHLAEHSAKPAPETDMTTTECPGTAPRVLRQPADAEARPDARKTGQDSSLVNWPVQLHLVPVRAPNFDGGRLLIAADCVPFALADFHAGLLAGRNLVIGCPKLDDSDLYRRKLAQIFLQNDIREVEIAYMEVPCCYGLVHLVRQALQDSKKAIPLFLTKVSIKGVILEKTEAQNADESEVQE